MSGDTGSLVGSGEHLKVACDDSRRILNEIEDLRAQLDEDVKKLGYCEANQKLRVELALKAKEVQCLRKQNEEMHAKYDGMRKSNEELQNKNDDLAKQNEELQGNNNDLVKQNEVLQTSNDGMKNGEPQAKNDGLVKQNEELQTMSDGMRKGNRELRAKNDSLMKRSEELQAKIDGLTKQNEELQAKNDGLTKWNSKLQAKNDSMRTWNKELQAKNVGLHKNIKEILENEIDTKRKHLLQFEELYNTVNFPVPQLEERKRMLHKSSVEANPLPSFEEIGRLQAQVTKLETTIDQLMANIRTLVKTKAALKEEVAAYAADLEHTRKKNRELESKKASAEQLMAMFQQVQDVSDIGFDDTELDTRICDLMVTGCKSKSHSKRNKEHRRDIPTNKKVS